MPRIPAAYAGNSVYPESYYAASAHATPNRPTLSGQVESDIGIIGTDSHLFGRVLAEAVHRDQSRFDVFAKLPWFPFLGGRLFRMPYSVMGSWWYGLRDALGV